MDGALSSVSNVRPSRRRRVPSPSTLVCFRELYTPSILPPVTPLPPCLERVRRQYGARRHGSVEIQRSFEVVRRDSEDLERVEE